MNTTHQEQIEADLIEGIAPADEATMELIEQFRDLTHQIKALKVQTETISALIKETMSANHLKHLTDASGVDVTTLSVTHRTNFNRKAAAAELGEDTLNKFTTTTTSERLLIK